MSRRRTSVPLAAALVALAGCGSTDREDALAQAGRIDATSPIRTSRTILISAPPARVWAVLTDIGRWPAWQPEITGSRLEGPLRVGSHFGWASGDTHLAARLALVRPPVRIAWTGKAFGLRAIHVWTLTPLRGRVSVRTDESMAGFPGSLFYSSAELGAADGRWLARLKSAAEGTDSAAVR